MSEPLPSPKVADAKRIDSVRFVDSVPFRSESNSMSVGPTGADSITPARMEADGQAVPIAANQRADGLLLVRRVHDRASNRWFQEKVFVPWANVRAVRYVE